LISRPSPRADAPIAGRPTRCDVEVMIALRLCACEGELRDVSGTHRAALVNLWPACVGKRRETMHAQTDISTRFVDSLSRVVWRRLTMGAHVQTHAQSCACRRGLVEAEWICACVPHASVLGASSPCFGNRQRVPCFGPQNSRRRTIVLSLLDELCRMNPRHDRPGLV
jgi:hypothetical protein